MGEIAGRKKRNSSKTMQTAREAGYFGKKMLLSARQAMEEGRPTAWSMADWWVGSTIARAMGVEVVYPENYGAFCAAAGAAEENLDYCVSDGFPSTICGYARNGIGYARKLKDNSFVIPKGAPGGGMVKPVFLLACGAVCDTRYKWFQALGRYMDVPVWTMELPQTGSAEFYLKGNRKDNIKFIVQEMRGFISFLEKILGKKMDWDVFNERLATLLQTHDLAYKVSLLRKAVPSPMVSTDLWSIMLSHLYVPDDPEALVFYKRVYAEVKNRVDNKIGAIPGEKYRILFAELPPWHYLGFFDEIAEKYGVSFVMESWGYQVPPSLTEEEKEGVTDPLELLAMQAYNKFHHDAPFAYENCFDPPIFTASYVKWAKEYRADGFMGHPLMSCRPATYTLLHLRNLLMEKCRVPSVIIEGDIVDFRVFNEDEAWMKVDAFMETMDHFREVRKKEGFDW
jgi:benzoyl-CoA reductase/2-hydroxyglutaryl-CoA dehydratase subunit BcrC/BadD/HgdB